MTTRGVLHPESIGTMFSLERRPSGAWRAPAGRLFAAYVGIGPKWVLPRYRLHEAVEQLQAQNEVDWSPLALELGYYDQAHFARDFRSLVGRTPAQYDAARPDLTRPQPETEHR